MKVLFDAHAFIWWDSDPDQLSTAARACCTDSSNELILSVASLWEIQIKHQIRKLNLRLSLADMVANQQATNEVIILPIIASHIFVLDSLPLLHKDPFDRLLVAQAISEGATLVSTDPIFALYPVPVLW